MKPRVIAFSDLTPAPRRALASWLADRIGEMEIDESFIADELGVSFMPSLRGLLVHVKGAGAARKGGG